MKNFLKFVVFVAVLSLAISALYESLVDAVGAATAIWVGDESTIIFQSPAAASVLAGVSGGNASVSVMSLLHATGVRLTTAAQTIVNRTRGVIKRAPIFSVDITGAPRE